MLVPNPITPQVDWDLPSLHIYKKGIYEGNATTGKEEGGMRAKLEWQTSPRSWMVPSMQLLLFPPVWHWLIWDVRRGFVGPVTRGLTQHQLKFLGLLLLTSTLSALGTTAPISPLHAEHGDTTFRNQQGRYSWKITFWAWEGQLVPKEHTRKH